MDEQKLNEQPKIEESIVCLLEEMSEGMQLGLDNCKQVTEQQLELSSIVANSSSAEKFKQFIEETSKQVDDLSKQYEVLAVRKAMLDEVIAMCKADKTIEIAVTKFSKALGLFKEQA